MSAEDDNFEELINWVETTDKKTGKKYYANKKTRQTRWKPPPGFVEFKQKLQEAAEKEEEEMLAMQQNQQEQEIMQEQHEDISDNVGADIDLEPMPLFGAPKSPRKIDITSKSPKLPQSPRSPRNITRSPKPPKSPRTPRSPRFEDFDGNKNDDDLTNDAHIASSTANLISNLQENIDSGLDPYAARDLNSGLDDQEPQNDENEKAAIIHGDSKPGYWKECTDPKSNRKYYYHTVTRKRVWDQPAEYEELLEIYLEWKKNKKKKLEEPQSEPVLPTLSSFSLKEDNNEPLAEMGMQGPDNSNVGLFAPTISWDEEFVKPDDDTLATNNTNPDEENEEEEKWANTHDDLEIIEVEKMIDVPHIQFGEYRIEKYAEKYFNQHKSGIFSRLSFQDMIHFSNEPIKAPMLKKLNANAALSSDAVQTFRNISGYMGDRKTAKGPVGHIKKICKIAIDSPEEMRDEIYCQIIRQTNGNDKRDSYVKGWILMSICTSIFPPSEELAAYLSAYIQQSIEFANEISPYALFAQQRLTVTLQTGARKIPPSTAEIEAIEQRKTIATRVRFLDDSYKTLAIEPQTTCRTVCRVLGDRLALNNSECFALYELVDAVRSHVKETLVSPDERILDIMGKWEDQQLRFPDYSFKIVYRYHTIFEHEEDLLSDESLHMLFIQCVYDVVTGNYPIVENTALELSALQTQATYGGKDISLYSPGLLSQKLKEYVPRPIYEKRDLSYLEGRILQEHSKYINYTKLEAKKEYIKVCKEVPTYGCCYFRDVRQIMALSKDPPQPVVIGVSERGIFLIDPISSAVKTRWLFPEIVGYGHKEKEGIFMAIVGNNVKKNKFQFLTPEGRQIKEIVATYINKQVELQRQARTKAGQKKK